MILINVIFFPSAPIQSHQGEWEQIDIEFVLPIAGKYKPRYFIRYSLNSNKQTESKTDSGNEAFFLG